MKKLAVYIHWPYCTSKCPYCDFNSRPMPEAKDEQAWAQAYAREIAHYAERLPSRVVTSVYFGGGTPSLMSAGMVESIIGAVVGVWHLSPDCEITLEANPMSSDADKFKAFQQAGVNRLSLGVQSFDDAALRFLGRAHDAATARRAIGAMVSTFERWSFDLIYAREGQTLSAWESELREALDFQPRHLSLYQLTIEPGSIFYKRAAQTMLTAPDELAADMFDLTQSVLGTAGLPAYEVSNHAAPGQESRHNLTCWRYEDYVGIGPGAHGRFVDEAHVRHATENHKHPMHWMAAVSQEGKGLSANTELNLSEAQHEALLMGLRLTEGINAQRWEEKFGTSFLTSVSSARVQQLEQEGLLIWSGGHVRVTTEGMCKMNAILAHLLNG